MGFKIDKTGFLVLLSTLIHIVSANFIVLVQPKTSECYVETLTKDTKMSVSYSVSEGGNRDITIKIVGPHGLPVLEKEQTHDGKSEILAYADGEYEYCFDNTWSTHTAKTVMFAMQRDDVVVGVGEEEKDQESTLREMVAELQYKVTACRHEQEFMDIRLALHKKTTDNTNQMLLMWSIFECAVMAALAIMQTFHIKRMFEIRTLV